MSESGTIYDLVSLVTSFGAGLGDSKTEAQLSSAFPTAFPVTNKTQIVTKICSYRVLGPVIASPC